MYYAKLSRDLKSVRDPSTIIVVYARAMSDAKEQRGAASEPDGVEKVLLMKNSRFAREYTSGRTRG